MKSPVGVLVMAYGGPDSLDQIPGYLADIRAGRTTSQGILQEITQNYQAIGGRSPLKERTAAQVQALAARFDPESVKFYQGMRHLSPWIEDVVGRMISDGITQGVSLVLAPHYSGFSIAKYQQRIAQGEALYRGCIHWNHVKSFHTGRHLIKALARRVKDGLTGWSSEESQSVHVVFSAHSLPSALVNAGDPYQDQFWETCELVTAAAALERGQWSWCYQSAGRTGEAWLGPSMDDHIRALQERGIRNLVIIPLGFVSDHVEILYDIDIKARKLCDDLGIKMRRPPALNDDPVFIDQLEFSVREALEALD